MTARQLAVNFDGFEHPINKNSCGWATFAKTSCFVDCFTSPADEEGMQEHDLKAFKPMNHLRALGSLVTQRLVLNNLKLSFMITFKLSYTRYEEAG